MRSLYGDVKQEQCSSPNTMTTRTREPMTERRQGEPEVSSPDEISDEHLSEDEQRFVEAFTTYWMRRGSEIVWPEA